MTLAAGLDGRRAALAAAGLFCAAVGTFALADAVARPVAPSGDPGEVLLAYGVMLYAFLGVVVLWRRPGHGIGRVAMTIALALAVGLLLTVLARFGPPTEGVRPVLERPVQLLLDTASLMSEILLAGGLAVGGVLLLVWFPDGHRTSRLGAVIEVLLVVSVIGVVVASLEEPVLRQIRWSATKEAVFRVAGFVGYAGLFIAYIGAWLDLGLRYTRTDATRRTQMRWVWSAEGVSLLCAALLVFFGERAGWLWMVWFSSLGLPALAIAIAISRYHLYDIDRIVSRTIAYAMVSAILFSVFAVLIIGMQRVITGAAAPGTEPEPWVVAVSTLAVAALFNPLRIRIHRQVDHRFNRARYDSAAMVAGFSERLRDELDLPTVTNDLVTTAGRALEPTSGVIWLRGRPDQA